MIVAIIVLIAIGGGVGIWHRQTKPKFETASINRMAYLLPDKPSIAVLAFENYSGDAKLDFFASGLTEDLTASLLRELRKIVCSCGFRGKIII